MRIKSSDTLIGLHINMIIYMDLHKTAYKQILRGLYEEKGQDGILQGRKNERA